MIYRFGPFELDLAAVELRADGVARSLEPQVFALLALLVENHARLVSKDEIIEKVWDGRVVTDAAVASRVKSARQALGDDGVAQRFIKTVHRKGFRFVAPVRASRSPMPCLAPDTGDPDRAQNVGTLVRQLERMSRPSLAVLPFRTIGEHARYAALASALPDELITELSRLRWLFVTARGSSFRVSAANAAFSEIGRLLGVRYCLSGALEIADRRLNVTVELVDAHDEGVVWADRFSGRIDDV
ncbi:MAG TPA: winged helix-turn-helix domain-containing protein, partial [Steroidobacteraceae bacterium]|nr:winged helix-turn-helix domain-containing protein [Steroidobacteraceae bacterium]